MIRDTDIPSMVVGGGARDPNPAAVRIAAVSDARATGATAWNRLHHGVTTRPLGARVRRPDRKSDPQRHRVKRMIVVKLRIASRIVRPPAVDHQAGPAASAAAASQKRMSAGMVHLTEAGRCRGGRRVAPDDHVRHGEVSRPSRTASGASCHHDGVCVEPVHRGAVSARQRSERRGVGMRTRPVIGRAVVGSRITRPLPRRHNGATLISVLRLPAG